MRSSKRTEMEKNEDERQKVLSSKQIEKRSRSTQSRKPLPELKLNARQRYESPEHRTITQTKSCTSSTHTPPEMKPTKSSSASIVQHGRAKRPSTVNRELILPSVALNEDLQPLSYKAEEQSRRRKSVQAHISTPVKATPEVKNTRTPCPKKAGCCKVKAKKSKGRVAENKNSNNRKVTDYFPIRRSLRKSKTELKCEQKKHLDELITNGIENGMMVKYIEGKGRGVFATQSFQKGQFVVEYHGDLLLKTDAKKREAVYAQDPATGCYMYYFQYLSKTYCVDATKETERLGRLINHSKTGNCQTKLHDINGIPHLILVASRDIEEGEELLYDYGDRSRASIAAHPWLKH
ncbi:N-lysine methyltransferase KMT5A-A [Bagarius yarrelli]|uniref:[histone H4]-lysine(20) N-methyltransferase n=1 Tax=Bagarius yarrelli TaxID=175774 RepID=A0A556U3A0_BAGYA|nr:N-lysine methyltransferase KMT5A-A [Bagarius yarrelli]